MNLRFSYNQEDIEKIVELYPDHTLTEIAQAIGRTERYASNVVSQLRLEGFMLEKSDFFKQNKSGRFAKGIEVWNKGLTGYMGANITSFKKGNAPHNKKNIGDLVQRKSAKDKYVLIKVAEPNDWEYLHRWVWQMCIGDIPKGCLVKFIDGDVTNCNLDNLYLQDMKGNMIQNSIHNYPKEAKNVLRKIKKLKKIIKEKQKKIC